MGAGEAMAFTGSVLANQLGKPHAPCYLSPSANGWNNMGVLGQRLDLPSIKEIIPQLLAKEK